MYELIEKKRHFWKELNSIGVVMYRKERIQKLWEINFELVLIAKEMGILGRVLLVVYYSVQLEVSG